MRKETYFFGESVVYSEDGEKEEATQYLLSWKKFLIRKLNRECASVKVIDEQWIHRESHLMSMLAQYASMGLKLAVEIEFKFEIEPFAVNYEKKT